MELESLEMTYSVDNRDMLVGCEDGSVAASSADVAYAGPMHARRSADITYAAPMHAWPRRIWPSGSGGLRRRFDALGTGAVRCGAGARCRFCRQSAMRYVSAEFAQVGPLGCGGVASGKQAVQVPSFEPWMHSHERARQMNWGQMCALWLWATRGAAPLGGRHWGAS
eukprot:360589-Chlamydomonas_euryale.AAC.3